MSLRFEERGSRFEVRSPGTEDRGVEVEVENYLTIQQFINSTFLRLRLRLEKSGN